MIRRPPSSTRTDTLFPYPTLFRSGHHLAVPQIAQNLARRRLGHAEGDAAAGSAPVEPEHQPRPFPRAAIMLRIDAEGAVIAAQQRRLPLQEDESRVPHQGAVAEDPDVPIAWQGIEIGLPVRRSEEHTSELQSLMRISYAVFCLKKKNKK